MPDLELLLRDVRPAPDPAWTARLDARVAQRFPGPPPKWRLPLDFARGNLLPLGSLAAVAIVIVLGALALRVGGGASSGSSEKSSSAGSAATPSAASADSAGGSASSRQPAPSAPASPAAARDVLRSAQLTLSTRTAEVADVSDRAIRVVDRLGGYVASSSVSSSDSRARASLTLAIPSAKLQQALTQLSELGHVSKRSQDAQDVTDQRAALEAAVRDARADRAGLRSRLAKAATDKERSRLRAQLVTAARRITARERAVAALTRQVSYATVDLSIVGRRAAAAVPAPAGRWTPADALHDARRVLEVAAGVLLIALAVLLPLGLVGGLGAVARRLVVRRRREHALEMA